MSYSDKLIFHTTTKWGHYYCHLQSLAVISGFVVGFEISNKFCSCSTHRAVCVYSNNYIHIHAEWIYVGVGPHVSSSPNEIAHLFHNWPTSDYNGGLTRSQLVENVPNSILLKWILKYFFFALTNWADKLDKLLHFCWCGVLLSHYMKILDICMYMPSFGWGLG